MSKCILEGIAPATVQSTFSDFQCIKGTEYFAFASFHPTSSLNLLDVTFTVSSYSPLFSDVSSLPLYLLIQYIGSYSVFPLPHSRLSFFVSLNFHLSFCLFPQLVCVCVCARLNSAPASLATCRKQQLQKFKLYFQPCGFLMSTLMSEGNATNVTFHTNSHTQRQLHLMTLANYISHD